MKSPFLFTIIALPQYYQAGILRFNVVFIPRNISPINDLSAWGFPTVGSYADADIEFKLEAKVIAGFDSLPDATNVTYQESLDDISVPASARPIFEALNLQFNGIDDIPNNDQTPPQLQASKFIKKYLPISYRNAFNFTNPRTKDAVIDDSYHCAFKDKGNDPNFKQSSDRVSWGKVYAHCLRHPELAKNVGLIYTDINIEVPEGSFEKGGWLYVDFPDPLATPHFYADIQVNPTPIIKRYAARIPAMDTNDERVLFAPILFPVAFGTPISGIYDEVQREAADYDDGFAKIVHLFQPISTNFLQEKQDQNTISPTKDVGIRLGWDDEQVLIWQNRQLKADPSAGANQVLDAPLGVAKYYIDVRIKKEVEDEDPWISLNLVQPKAVMTLGGQTIMNPTQQLELGTEVYPMQLSGDKNANFWLPSYFTQWSGKSMVLPDEDAHAIYRIEEESRAYVTGDNITKDLKVSLARQYNPVGLEDIELRYGSTYEFRVRMGDISGGGPKSSDKRFFESIAKDTSITFKRNVPPNAIRMEALPDNGAFYREGSIRLRRPIIEFPNVEFTRFYSNLVDKLSTYSLWTEGKGVAKLLNTGEWSKGESYPVGLPDPDVNVVEITVEVKALQMDHKLSASGKEPYYKLYTITRDFPTLNPNAAVLGAANELDPFQNIESPLELPIEFRDATVINFDENADFGEWPVTREELENGINVILPTGRDLRITLRPLGENDPDYFGFEAWKKGKTTQFILRQTPKEELNLFNPAYLIDAIKGIYLQANKVISNSGVNHFLGSFDEGGPGTPIQRLAQQLKVQTKDNSLVAYPGIRAQFGCSRRVRHTLAPDGTSITFSTETDLLNHWLVCLKFELQRDWSWDAMDVESFVIMRSKKFSREETFEEEEEVGSIDLHTTINLQALDNPIRSHTDLIFIDAVEPKKDPGLYNLDPFPDTIELSYRVIPQFKPNHVPENTALLDLFELTLPVTTIPIQEPKLASAGLALSPYRRDEKYANTEPRRKYLWFELKEPIQDPNDTLFIRLLGYAPDPLLSDLNKYPELLTPPIEPAIALDPEWIRVIRSGQADDHSGLNAMTELEGAIVGEGQQVHHFIVPLPPGMHPDSDELFGFFTYELRIGHKHIWSTALGRFGRPLRVTGVQHPAPNLYCTVERTKKEIKVVAPYALAVHNAKNVTARPPRTELWTLLYAQVKMANNEDYRNILLGELPMKQIIRRLPSYSRDILESGFRQMQSFENSDKGVNGIATFPLVGIEALLSRLGLPLHSPLSVLTVEFFPTEYKQLVSSDQQGLIKANRLSPDPFFDEKQLRPIYPKERMDGIPLSRDLGQYRILRTSPLVAVPEVCCEDC